MNDHLKLSQAGANLIQHFEGCLQKKGEHFVPYRCPAGVWTVGWGTTRSGGKPIDPSIKWTASQCNAAFLADMGTYERDVRKCLKVPVSQNEWDALVSFHYNTGALPQSTLLKKLNSGDRKGAAAEFHRWNKGGGKVLAGLTRRRASESLLFQGIPDLNYDGKADPKPPVQRMPQAVDSPED